MDKNTKFLPILEKLKVNKNTKNILITSGKYSYDIKNIIESSKKTDTTALVVLEELAPFPEKELKEILANANVDKSSVYWV